MQATDQPAPMPPSQRIVQICLFLFAAIAISGGALQMALGQPETTPRLDNIHRFLAGLYFGCGLICLWAAITVRRQHELVYLIAAAVFAAGVGRLASMALVGLPEPRALWLAYLVPELGASALMAAAQLSFARRTPASTSPQNRVASPP
jgi:hypothetical protein